MKRYFRLEQGMLLIEIIIALAVFAIAFVPVSALFGRNIKAAASMKDIATAYDIAINEIEWMKYYLADPAHSLNDIVDRNAKKQWRIERDVIEETNPVKIAVRVYQANQTENVPLAEIITSISAPALSL